MKVSQARETPRSRGGWEGPAPARKRRGWILLAVAFAGACHSFDVTLHEGGPAEPSSCFRVGAGRRDITPPPGYPMGGYSREGRVAVGRWTPLLATAFAFADPGGEILVLISADLWAAPLALSDRVAERIAAKHPAVGRSSVVLAATHTHHSPGAMAGSPFWNRFAAPLPGFDPDWFEWLAARLAAAACDALDSLEPAALRFGSADAAGFARNRSLDAFVTNEKERPEFQASVRRRIGEGISDAEASVDPRVSVLALERPGGGGLIGAMVFSAVHPTATGMETAVYSGDVFAIAAGQLERGWTEDPERKPLVAFFNGAEGDVAAGPREDAERNHRLALEVAERLAGGARRAFAQAVPADGGPVVVRSVRGRMGEAVDDGDAGAVPVARTPLVGAPVLGGANDGQTSLRKLGLQPGLRRIHPRGDHGVKLSALEGILPVPAALAHLLLGIALPPSCYPGVYQAGVHAVGDVLIVTLPGEFTTIAGARILQAARRSAGWGDRPVVAVGIADAFLYYVATASEYDVQEYEGAATLYGPNSAAFFESVAERLASAGGPVRIAGGVVAYRPGFRRSFALAFLPEAGADPWAGVRHLLPEPAPVLPRFSWIAAPFLWPSAADGDAGWPVVAVEELDPAEGWVPRPDALAPGSLLLLLRGVESASLRFEAVVLAPPAGVAGPWRFRCRDRLGEEAVSPPLPAPAPQGRE